MRAITFFVGTTFALALASACSSKNSITSDAGASSGTTASCSGAPALGDDDFCSSCTFASAASPATCKAPRVVDACCVYVTAPQGVVARGTGLHYFSSTDPTVDLGCLTTPPAAGASKTVTLSGHVKLFANGGDSANVKIEIYTEGANGALGQLVGSAFTTSADDATDPAEIETWSTTCPPDGCKLRSYTYANVPTETRLIIKTSDASGTGSQWSDLYDYNIYISNASLNPDGTGSYDPSTVAATDVNTVASAAGGFTVDPTKGVVAGEVHDCGDVRLAGAFVDTDLPHQADSFYFTENESNPLPDTSRSSQGTSHLGLFGMLNLQTGTPIRISAIGNYNNQAVLLGTYTIQTYPGAVTALSFRGRRPYQTSP